MKHASTETMPMASPKRVFNKLPFNRGFSYTVKIALDYFVVSF